MAQQLTFGSVVLLQAGGDYLGISQPIRGRTGFERSPESYLVTTYADCGRSNAEKVRWRISSAAAKKSGDPVVVGDKVHLRNVTADGGVLDTCGWIKAGGTLSGPGDAYIGKVRTGVFTSDKEDRDSGSGTWTIRKDGVADGQPISAGDAVSLSNAYQWDGGAGSLVAYGVVADNPAFRDLAGQRTLVFAAQDQAVLRDHGQWTVVPASIALGEVRALPNGGLFSSGGPDGVHALAASQNGVVIGGCFERSADSKITDLANIARFAQGAWSAFPNRGLDNVVYGLLDTKDGLYVIGPFNQTKDRVVSGLNGIARFSDGRWSALAGAGLKYAPSALAQIGDVLYVGGSVDTTHEGAKLSWNIAAYTQGRWSSLPNNGLDQPVDALAAVGSDLYAGGNFRATVDGAVKGLGGVACFSGGTWRPLANGGLDGPVRAFAVIGSDLYAGGDFTATADGTVKGLSGIARYSAGAWYPLTGSGLVADNGSGSVYVLHAADGILYAAGHFDSTVDGAVTGLGNYARYVDARWYGNAGSGGLVLPADKDRQWPYRDQPNACLAYGGQVYVGGNFQATADGAVNGLGFIAAQAVVTVR